MKTEVSDINKISIIKVDDWKSAYIDIIENDYLNRMSLNEQIDKYNNSYSLKDGPDMKRMVIGSKLFNFVLNYFKTKEYDFLRE